MDLPYANTYSYSHDWSVPPPPAPPTLSDTFPLYSTTNHSTLAYNIPSCSTSNSTTGPSTSYYDYYNCPSTSTSCFPPYNSYTSHHLAPPVPPVPTSVQPHAIPSSSSSLSSAAAAAATTAVIQTNNSSPGNE